MSKRHAWANTNDELSNALFEIGCKLPAKLVSEIKAQLPELDSDEQRLKFIGDALERYLVNKDIPAAKPIDEQAFSASSYERRIAVEAKKYGWSADKIKAMIKVARDEFALQHSGLNA